MKTQHDGDCSIYSVLHNCNPEDGICNCGYGLEILRKKGSREEMYSIEVQEKSIDDKCSGLQNKIEEELKE